MPVIAPQFALPWLLQPGDPLPPLVLRGERWQPNRLLDTWTLLALGPPEQVHALRQSWAPVQPTALIAIASGQNAVGSGDDRDGLSAQRLGAWDGRNCLPVAVLVEPRGTVVAACGGGELAAAVAAAMALR
jgi:hypothetical protein